PEFAHVCFDPKRTSFGCQGMSAFEGKADMQRRPLNVSSAFDPLGERADFSQIILHLPARLSAADHLGGAGGLRDGFGLASPWVSPNHLEKPIKSGLDVPMASAFLPSQFANPGPPPWKITPGRGQRRDEEKRSTWILLGRRIGVYTKWTKRATTCV